MEIEVNGVKQMSGVKITKCRYIFPSIFVLDENYSIHSLNWFVLHVVQTDICLRTSTNCTRTCD